jgi:single-stranded-DNA-specific exonuclease
VKHRWKVAPEQPLLTRPLAAALRVSPLVAQCLVNRGHTDLAESAIFLEPRLKALADPLLLPDMAKAVERLFTAREAREPFVIFGDYDVDGVTATTILETGLTELGWTVYHYLPHRMDEGYGLSQAGVENCLARFAVPLLLAVDCGSTAAAQIAWLREQDVDVIVLDHHQVSEPPPETCALVNPQRAAADQRSFRELCSAGLAFKLLHAVLKHGRTLGLPEFERFDIKRFLDLVALGTVADLVPMIGENRILVTAGLQRLEVTERPGLIALKDVAQTKSPVGVYEVGFQLGPRLNAAGRLETAEAALDLLLAPDLETAYPIAQALDATNRERQGIEKKMADDAIGLIRSKFKPDEQFVIVEGHLHWHIGVVGIVASRVLREFYRPTIILGGDNDHWRGSGRSIAGFDLAAALRECGDLLVKHGGHAMAAGVTISPDSVDAFRIRLNESARRQISPELLIPELRLDAVVPLRELTNERMDELQKLAPFGQQNPAIQLLIPGVTHAQPPQRLGKAQQHWKFRLTDGATFVDALWWGAAAEGDEAPKGTFDVAAVPQVEEFNGRRLVRLRFLDWRPAQPADGATAVA